MGEFGVYQGYDVVWRHQQRCVHGFEIFGGMGRDRIRRGRVGGDGGAFGALSKEERADVGGV